MWVVDQIDEGIVCLECAESKELMYVDISDMPKDVQAGDFCEFASGKWVVDVRKTEARKVRIDKLFAVIYARRKTSFHKHL